MRHGAPRSGHSHPSPATQAALARVLWLLLALALLAGGRAAAAGNGLAYFSPNRIAVSLTSPAFNSQTGTFDVAVTLTNLSPTAVWQPLILAVTGTTPGTVTLANPDGLTADGLPYVTVPLAAGRLDPGWRVGPVLLKFGNTATAGFGFGQAVYGVSPGGNRPPMADAGLGQTAAPGQSVTLDGGASTDRDGDPLGYRWTLLRKPAGSAATLDGADTFHPGLTPDRPGDYLAQLVVSDGQADSLPAVVAVGTGNARPEARAGRDLTAPAGATATLDGGASTDAGHDPLSYRWQLTLRPAGSAAALAGADGVRPALALDLPGHYEARLTVNDGQADSAPDLVAVDTHNTPPVADAGPDRVGRPGDRIALDGSASTDADADPLAYRWSLLHRPPGSQATIDGPLAAAAALTPDLAGDYIAQLSVNDGQADSPSPDTARITVAANHPPAITSTPSAQATAGQPYRYAPAAADADGDSLGYSLPLSPPGMAIDPPSGLVQWTPGSADPGVHPVTLKVSDGHGGQDLQSFDLAVAPAPALPPDPASVAPPPDPTVAATVADATRFLYTGPDPIQAGVAPGAIEARRAAVLRGRALDRQGDPLSGVAVTVKGHPELGQTLTRADGWFDLAVNGGGPLTLEYRKDGWLPLQRQLQVPWQDYVLAEDVVLSAPDSRVSAVTLGADAPPQTAQGSVVADADGTRQASLLFPAGVQAVLELPDGTARPLSSLHVRATEYSVGGGGPKAMPGPLPPSSGYTYAVELSADEAVAAGAKSVRFDRPVPVYVDNFLGFPVGQAVPAGWYDRDRSAWIPSANGRVVKILAVEGGLAQVDGDGDGLADGAGQLVALGLGPQEQAQLAGLYPPGKTLWRVPVDHFTPWDYNWPFGPSAGAESPGQSPAGTDAPLSCPKQVEGSIIECQNQTLGERVAVTGTPYTLNYRSDRTPGRGSRQAADIPLSGPSVPPGLKRIELETEVAGQRARLSFPPQAGQSWRFQWDGKDAYGRPLRGTATLRVRVGYVYDAVYRTPSEFLVAFGAPGGAPAGGGIPPDPTASLVTGARARQEVTLWQESAVALERQHLPEQDLAGWTLDVQHAYDPAGKVLHLGGGDRRDARAEGGLTLATAVGADLAYPWSVAAAPDGSLYVADHHHHRVRRVSPDGTAATVIGTGSAGFGGDGGSAAAAQLNSPTGVALGPDGSLYVADYYNHRVRRVSPDGTATTLAGDGTPGSGGDGGDGGPATAAKLNFPVAVAVGPDGSVYIADQYNDRIRRVAPGGLIATWAVSYHPAGVAVAPDGSVYVAEQYNHRVRRVGPDGSAVTVAGNGSPGSDGDGGPASAARLYLPAGVAAAPDGSLYIADFGNHRVRRVAPDGTIATVVGGTQGTGGDGGPAAAAKLNFPIGVATGPDGNVYVADTYNHRIRRAGPALPGLGAGDVWIPSADGGEIYQFDARGRHLRTLDALTGAALHRFAYTADGLLASVTDADGNATAVERDAAGRPAALMAPFGQRTTLALDAQGRLAALANPAGEAHRMEYDAGGLLTRFADPAGAAAAFAYDADGRLTADTDAESGVQTLARAEFAGGYEVRHATPLGRATTHRVEHPPGGVLRTDTGPDGLAARSLEAPDGHTRTELPDGTAIDAWQSGDPRFGLAAPFESARTVSSGGLILRAVATRAATLTDPRDPLSLTALVETETVNGKTATAAYDAATRTLTRTSPVGRRGTATLDAAGRVVRSQAGGLLPATRAYDARGRLVRVAQGEGDGERAYAYAYDAQGRLESATDPLGRVTRYAYDPAGRIATQTLPGGREVRHEYDPAGRPASLAPPGRAGHGFRHGPLGLPAEYDPPPAAPGGPTAYAHDPDRAPLRVDLPGGQSVQFRHDSAGRLQTLTTPEGDILYSYDPAGRPARVAAPGGVGLAFAYAGAFLARAEWTGEVAGSVGYAHDNDFRLREVTVGGHDPAAYAYDPDGLPVQAGQLAIARDPQSGLPAATALGVVGDSRARDGFGETTAYAAQSGTTALYAYSLAYDKLGRITQKAETVQGASSTYAYAYDEAGRLAEVRRDGVLTASHGYDANGNRVSVNGSVVATHDGQDRLLTHGGTVYTYTANGELESKTAPAGGGGEGLVTRYRYDALGNLRHVGLPGGAAVDYLIDGHNRRVGKKLNGVLVQGFLWQDGLRVAAELDGNNAVVARFVHATHANVPDYLVKGGIAYRILTDHLGSPRLVVNAATGEVAQRMDYDEWGRVTLDTNPGFQPFGFAGGLYDRDTGLVRFGARDYDPEVGRWTAKDPILFGGGDGNLYAYVGGDPLNGLDPAGLFMTTVDATCANDPSFCAELLGTMLENHANITQGCVTEGQQAALDTIRGMGNVAAVGSVVKSGMTNRVIGRSDDLEKAANFRPGEKPLDFHAVFRRNGKIVDRPTWYGNHRALRSAMREGKPIRDMSPDDYNGTYLNWERSYLKYQGWEKQTIEGDTWWVPPSR